MRRPTRIETLASMLGLDVRATAMLHAAVAECVRDCKRSKQTTDDDLAHFMLLTVGGFLTTDARNRRTNG